MSTSTTKPNKKRKQREKNTAVPIKCIVVDDSFSDECVVHTEPEKQVSVIKAECYKQLETGTNEDIRLLHSFLEEIINNTEYTDWDATDEESDNDCHRCGNKKHRCEDHYQSEWSRKTRIPECKRLLDELVQLADMEKWYELVKSGDGMEGIHVGNIE